MGGRKSVKPRDPPSRIEGDETARDTALHILKRQRLDIPFEFRDAASEIRAWMLPFERVGDEGGHRTSRTSRRWAAIAFSNPGATSGGCAIASAKARCPSAERRKIVVSSIVRAAASCAALTTKSLTLRP